MNDEIKISEQKQQQFKRKKRNLKPVVNSFFSAILGASFVLIGSPYFNNIETVTQETVSLVEPLNSELLTMTNYQEPKTVSMIDAVKKVSPAIVGIVNIQERSGFYPRTLNNVESGTGTGFVFQIEGNEAYIVTNNHVIEGASELEVSFYNGETEKAEVIGADPLLDLAVVKVKDVNVTDKVEFGNSDLVEQGEPVIAIGNPLGLEFSHTVTQGIVSATQRSLPVTTSDGYWELGVIQTDAAINPGNSGGALVNRLGKVIGVNSLKISRSGIEGLGFAIPSNDVVPIITDLLQQGKVNRPYLGVSLVELANSGYQQTLPITEGLVIAHIESNSLAEQAGLEIGDVIFRIDDQEIETVTDLRKYLYSVVKLGDKITLSFYRDGLEKSVEIVLEVRQTNEY